MTTPALFGELFGHKAAIDRQFFEKMALIDATVHAERRLAALRILNHAHVVDRIFAAHLRGAPHGYTATNTTETPELDALAQAVAETDAWYQSYVAAIAPEALSEPIAFTFTDGDAGRMTRAEMLLHVCLHSSNHRGAVGQLLKECGVPPPRDLLTRYLHQTEPSRRQP